MQKNKIVWGSVISLVKRSCKNVLALGGSPGLVVMGGDSCSKGHRLESQCHMLDGHFSTFIGCKNCNFCLKRQK